ncbi:glycosyltransferase [Galbitalea soli]|uniref:Glycosyltransferase n=1 Tax=Galbitalea soli TaxID=1268042 RepID=A0A7C9PM51_9MICO|nr:glycosyltransferase [Galbitalea soli]NEM90710.1 glycosyltransferase [Galbitalea soli]NYJ31428.1 cellulose synthase (UDP-forming) [Galbitalea soli]
MTTTEQPRAALTGPARPTPSGVHPHLPTPPSDAEKYSYFGVQRRWPFVWLFLAQLLLTSCFALVMAHNPAASLGLILLTFLVPPMVVNLWLRLRRRRVGLEDHVVRIEDWRRGRTSFPSVDVFLPSCGEDPAVLDNTFRHVKALDWPGSLTIHVLDDADDPATRELAARWGLRYVVRPNRGEWKKAGNLIHAFEHSQGDFIAVFDADFAPRPDFLWETVPYMAESETGVVQTAQYFDVDGRVNEFARFAGSLQELFFRWIQPARDTYEAAICAGTNVVYRRAAVVAAGGFARVPLGEDVHSGVKIWVANYRTRYLPLVLAKGLAPDTWAALTNQQYRWCRSSMLLMVSTFFREAPFSLQQRICFWAAFLYYMSSAAMVLIAVLPTLVIVWFYPGEIRPALYLPMLPAIAATLLVFPLLARGWRPTIFRVCMINTFCHVQAVYDALRDRVQAWVPTGAAGLAPVRKKGDVPRRTALIARVWFLTTQALLWAGIVRDWSLGVDPLRMWPTIALGAVQFAMLAPTLLTLKPAHD